MKTSYRKEDLKITKVAVFVELDSSTEARALHLKESSQEELIALIQAGMFHEDSITISDEVWTGLKFIKKDK